MSNIKKEETPEQVKQRIISLFYKNVKGKIPDTKASNKRHDGGLGVGRGIHFLNSVCVTLSATPELSTSRAFSRDPLSRSCHAST